MSRAERQSIVAAGFSLACALALGVARVLSWYRLRGETRDAD